MHIYVWIEYMCISLWIYVHIYIYIYIYIYPYIFIYIYTFSYACLYTRVKGKSASHESGAVCVTWLIHMNYMTHSYLPTALFNCSMSDMTFKYTCARQQRFTWGWCSWRARWAGNKIKWVTAQVFKRGGGRMSEI